ncbi:MAG TPA: DNA primase [Dehalococcoidia bacterium]|nr:DNA primase [Dehalococcoidia bacterium]
MSDLDAIRDRVDIVELVGESVRLQRAGRTYKGLCPFHTERTPSFIVSPDRRTWHCFGSCSTGGDVFGFVMRRDNVNFGESVRLLAARAGIALETRDARADEATSRLQLANEAAAAYFHHALLNSTAATVARGYAEERGLDGDAIRNFQIGFAPESWDTLASHLRGKGYRDEELVEAGLLVQGDRGIYDRFRARLMFPIRDPRGKVTGFGGRALGDAMPKYLNSPQSPIFDKGGLLYALDRAAESIRHESMAVIVEGYLDVITAHQHGYANVVASLGTALNERHITLLRRYTRAVALALDADEAGIEAAARGEQIIREMGDNEQAEVFLDWGNLIRVQSRAPVGLRIFTVPSGKDPDEAIRAEPDAWPGWVASALPPFEFRLNLELRRLDRADPSQRLELLDRMVPLLAEVSDRVSQGHYIQRLAAELAVREDDVRARLNALRPARREGNALLMLDRSSSQIAAPAVATGLRTESFCLSLLIRFEQLRVPAAHISPDWFTSTPHRRLFELWRESTRLDEDAVPDELQPYWRAAMEARTMPAVEVDPGAALSDCLRRMELRRLDMQKRLLTATLVDQGDTSDTGEPQPRGGPADDAAEIESTLRDDIEVARSLHELEYRLRTGREPPPSLSRRADDPPSTETQETAPDRV